jgi:hypothetical protein
MKFGKSKTNPPVQREPIDGLELVIQEKPIPTQHYQKLKLKDSSGKEYNVDLVTKGVGGIKEYSIRLMTPVSEEEAKKPGYYVRLPYGGESVICRVEDVPDEIEEYLYSLKFDSDGVIIP